MERFLAMYMPPMVACAATTTTLFAALLMLPAEQSHAFHDSQLDQPTKQFLVGAINRMQQFCNEGIAKACEYKETTEKFAEQFAQDDRACAAGNREKCQAVAAGREIVGMLKAQMGNLSDEQPRSSLPQARPLPNQRDAPSGPLHGSSERLESSRDGACHVFEIMLEGKVGSNYAEQSFRNTQFAVLRDKGVRQHRFEFIIHYQGDPNGFDVQVGVIELMTNSIFARNKGIASAGIDLASTSSRGNTLVFQLDPQAALQMPQPNMFVAPGASASPGGFGSFCVSPALGSLCEQFGRLPMMQTMYLIPSQGTVQFQVPTPQTIEGNIDIVGFGLNNSNLQARYQARFNGRFVKSEACP